MKILWIVNLLLPDAAEHLGLTTGTSGTWMIDISRKLSETEDIELAIACVRGEEFKKFTHKNITWYLLPGNGRNMLHYTKKYEKIWKEINEDFKPDIVHIHGTEYSHGLSFLRACPKVKSVISIQGMLNRIKDVDFAEIPLKHLIFNRTLRQNLRLNGEIELHLVNKINAKYESEMLKRTKYINAVSTWDSAICKSINPKLKVYLLEYNLRQELYESRKWDIDKINRHTIFSNPGAVPLKGLHQLLKAVALLKSKYPDILVKVPGVGVNGKLVTTSAYLKYISKLIKQFDIADNVEFLGPQSSAQMRDNILSANVTVVPSSIEGASLVLREAMFLGCPVICSFRGGMADFVSDKHDGFLYDFQEYPYLADRIDRIFSNYNLANEFSKNAIVKAEKAHDRAKNTQDYLNMYYEIFND